MAGPFHNLHLLAGDDAREALERLVALCRDFAEGMPSEEAAQAEGLEAIIAAASREIRGGVLGVAPGAAPAERVVRLYKERAGRGRLKLQLFPLGAGEAHPPHAHHDLVSCQLALAGRARVHEYSLLDRPAADALEIREQPAKTLAPGDGVITLQRRNHVHWQEGLTAGTLLLNINWQGYLPDDGRDAGRSSHGRLYLDWNGRRPGREKGCFLVRQIPVDPGQLTADGDVTVPGAA